MLNLLLCSRSETVRTKWIKALADNTKIYQALSFDEMQLLNRRFQVDVVLLHRSMVDTNQLKEICRTKGDSKIFILSDRPDDAEGTFCLQLGCVGYANTYVAPQRLEAAVDAVGSGLVWVGNSLMQYLIRGLGAADLKEHEEVERGSEVCAFSQVLSKREYQIAGLVAEGHSNTEIAEQLGITERTVKAHLSSIYAKTQTKGRLSLALQMNKR